MGKRARRTASAPRFPASRLKQMMQADEEVGKLSSAVPVLMSHAVEFFIEELVGGGGATARARGARTVSASHLRHVVESDACFDFVREHFADVAPLSAASAPGDARATRATREQRRASKADEPAGAEAKAVMPSRGSRRASASASAGGGAKQEVDGDGDDGGDGGEFNGRTAAHAAGSTAVEGAAVPSSSPSSSWPRETGAASRGASSSAAAMPDAAAVSRLGAPAPHRAEAAADEDEEYD